MPVLLALHDSEEDNDLPPVLRAIAPGWEIVTEHSGKPFAFGYGRGADRAAELLFSGELAGAILLRPSEAVPAAQQPLTGIPVAIIAGHEGECQGLLRAFTEAGAQLDFAFSGQGRDLTPQDFALAKQWLQGIRAGSSKA